ncbi:helix-turn-helix domain-containing protein [Nostoc sp.]|uniref:helix-turn-helix domain-containing protein n=1 Tax=Nostoc sp. TaxID=1180 RepID=UPI002FF6CC51
MIKVRCRLKDLMQERGIPQTKIATDTGLSPNTVGKLFRNEISQVKVDTIVSICQYFDIEFEDLFETLGYQASNY